MIISYFYPVKKLKLWKKIASTAGMFSKADPTKNSAPIIAATTTITVYKAI
jgi:hypothetical protein